MQTSKQTKLTLIQGKEADRCSSSTLWPCSAGYIWVMMIMMTTMMTTPISNTDCDDCCANKQTNKAHFNPGQGSRQVLILHFLITLNRRLLSLVAEHGDRLSVFKSSGGDPLLLHQLGVRLKGVAADFARPGTAQLLDACVDIQWNRSERYRSQTHNILILSIP